VVQLREESGCASFCQIIQVTEESMSVQLQRRQPVIDTIDYPESDGKPMAESDLHRDLMFYLIHLLQRFFADQQVYVSGNLLIYYEEGNPLKAVAPDCFVAFGVTPHKRRTFKIWEEGVGPAVVIEVSSRKTRREDLTTKKQLYARLGVREYFIYDPTADYLRPPLVGFTLAAAGYQPMHPLLTEERPGKFHLVPGATTPPEFISRVLGLRLTLSPQNDLLLYNLATGERLLTDEEARRVAEERATDAEERAIDAEDRAIDAEERAARVAAENERLRAELARLRGETTGRDEGL
jgi:Uma2 family endonuclease